VIIASAGRPALVKTTVEFPIAKRSNSGMSRPDRSVQVGNATPLSSNMNNVDIVFFFEDAMLDASAARITSERIVRPHRNER
jgi:hypothetical protein